MNNRTAFLLTSVFLCLSLLPLSCRTRNNSSAPREASSGYEEVVASSNLSLLLLTEQSKKACDSYFTAVDELKKKTKEDISIVKLKNNIKRDDILLCGRYMFFYGGKPAAQVMPGSYLEQAFAVWKDRFGAGFSELGLIPNPDDPGFPIGIAPAQSKHKLVNLANMNNGRTITCAFCHVGRLPDGRYSVGMPNETLDFGRFNMISSYPMWALSQSKNSEKDWPSGVIKFYEEIDRDWKNAAANGLVVDGKKVAAFPDLTFIPPAIPVAHSIFSLLNVPRLTKAEIAANLGGKRGAGNVFYIVMGTEETVNITVPTLWGIEREKTNPYGTLGSAF
jgi:hypothetical protein